MSDSTLAPNQYATYDEWDRAYNDHNREAASILHQMLGALDHMDKSGAREQHKAQAWDRYAAMVREWDTQRPEWVR